MTAIDEIRSIFNKYNIDVQLVYIDKLPLLDMTFEDENGKTVEIDFWEGRIKAYNIKEPSVE